MVDNCGRDVDYIIYLYSKSMKEETVKEINRLLTTGDTEKALSVCIGQMTAGDATADYMFWFLYGKILWKLGKIPSATTAYRRSIELNPESPAKIALEMSDDISGFFNPDLLNP